MTQGNIPGVAAPTGAIDTVNKNNYSSLSCHKPRIKNKS